MKMNAKNKTSYPHGQLACQQMNFRACESRAETCFGLCRAQPKMRCANNLLLQWEMISVFGRKCISGKQFRELRTMQPLCRQADYKGALWRSVPLKPP